MNPPERNIIIAIPPRLEGNGWKEIPKYNLPKIMYGLRRIGNNWQAIRIEKFGLNEFQCLGLPENLKEIALSNIQECLLGDSHD
jgi:hypothetical protein